MIYHITFNMMEVTTHINNWNATTPGLKERIANGNAVISVKEKNDALVEFIKKSSNDSFIFILVKRSPYKQWNKFPKWLKENGLDHLVVKETKGITNPVHTDNQHELKIVVLQSEDHFQRKEYVK